MELIVQFTIQFIKIIKLAIFIRILVSWVPSLKNNRIFPILFDATEPILKFFRNILPRTGMLDLSPLIAFFILDIIQSFLMKIIM